MEFKSLATTPKAIDPRQRTVRHLISTSDVDRDGDVLVHTGADYDGFLRAGGPVFFNHQANEQPPIGRCLNLTTGADGIEAVTQFAGLAQHHPDAERLFRLVKDGFLQSWSVGFRVIETSPERRSPGRTVTKWSIYEYSLVGVPANTRAVNRMTKSLNLPDGATDRDLLDALGRVPIRTYWALAAPILQDEKENTAMDTTQDIAGTIKSAIAPVIDRVAALEGRMLKPHDAADALAKSIGNGGREILKPSMPHDRAPGHLTSQGEQPVLVAEVFLALSEGHPERVPLVKSWSDTLSRAGYSCGPRSLLLPLGDAAVLYRMPGHESAIERVGVEVKQAFVLPGADPEEAVRLWRKFASKAMSPLDETLGGSLVDLPAQGPIIELLRSLEVVSRLGATQIPMPPQGSIHFPRETADATFQWLGPNGTITASNPSTGSLTLTAKRAGGIVVVPNDLLKYAPLAAEPVIRGGLAARAALTADLALLEGSGGANEPLGLIKYDRSADDTPTADKVTLHIAGTVTADGDTFLPEDVLQMMALVEEANDAAGASGWAMRPMAFENLANARADAVSASDKKGPFLFPITRGELGGAIGKVLAGLPVVTSTQVNKTSRKGSGTTLTYILCANWRRYFVGRVGVIELMASEHAGFASDATHIRAIVRIDGGPSHPQSFVICPTLKLS